MMPQHSIWRSMGFAFEGLRYAFSNQRSLRIESIIAGFFVVIGFAFDISRLEWVIVIISDFLCHRAGTGQHRYRSSS